MSIELGAKRLGLLHELLPRAARLAALVNQTSPNAEIVTSDAQPRPRLPRRLPPRQPIVFANGADRQSR